MKTRGRNQKFAVGDGSPQESLLKSRKLGRIWHQLACTCGKLWRNMSASGSDQLRAPTEEDEIDDEPVGAAAREEATLERQVLMYFPPPLSCDYAGTVNGYNGDKLGGYFYHVSYDDCDEQDHTWREVQLGIQWYETGGYINAPMMNRYQPARSRVQAVRCGL